MGIVNPKIKKDFLNRPLDNWDWMKKESKADMQLALQSIMPRPRFGKVKLWLHQMVCFLLMVHLKRFMLFLDMGGGKTLLTLMMIKYLKAIGKKPKAIVFVPYVITIDTWTEETEKWTKLKCVGLDGSSEKNLQAIADNPDADLFVICYQSAVAMLSKKKPAPKVVRGQPNKKKVEWILDGTKVRKLFKGFGFNFIAMDEIHKCKNPSSMTYRMCRAITKECEWAFGLTGTPFGRDLEDLWAQFYLVDLGETLGTTLGLFKEVFFRKSINYWGGFEFKFIRKLMPELTEMIKNRSIRYMIDECYDMPPKKYHTKVVKSNDAIAGYYNKIIEGLEALSFGKTKYREIESNYIRLKQLSSGFMTVKGDDKSKVEVKFPENPKLDALEELIESMPPESKMIVFHDFRYTNQLISERLTKMKVPHARVWGGAKHPLKELRKFKKDPKCRVIVLNCQAGSSSQNLQMANYVVYFEQPRSAIDRQQSERRAWRPGQKKRVLFFDLMMDGTLDFQQKANNQEGKNLLKRILDQRIKLRKL